MPDHLSAQLALADRSFIEFWVPLTTRSVIPCVCIINVQHYSMHMRGFIANAEHLSS